MKIRVVPGSPFFWNALYLLGKPPWDTGITPPELVEVVEGGQVPTGRALDIGCGTGTNAIYLAQHGFQTQGVDVAWLAIRRARRKARRAGVSVSLTAGSVLDLGTPKGLAIVTPVDLALDIGCLHSLPAKQRQSYAAMLQRVLRIGGFFLLYAWGPRDLRGSPVGMTPAEVQTIIGSSFRRVWVREGEEHGAPSYWYLFERTSLQSLPDTSMYRK